MRPTSCEDNSRSFDSQTVLDEGDVESIKLPRTQLPGWQLCHLVTPDYGEVTDKCCMMQQSTYLKLVCGGEYDSIHYCGDIMPSPKGRTEREMLEELKKYIDSVISRKKD